MGEVYRARDTRLGREVAIKVLPEHLTQSPDLRARFEREARTISSLNHPNICVLHDVGSENGIDFLVMELIEGETLHDRLQKGPLPLADVVRYGVQIADALERAHRAGVVHRDLKPGNVMITKSGAKLMDFGLARSEVGPASGPSNLSQSPTMTRPLTVEGHIVGTFQYMAPEQLEGRETDARGDVWALGCVIYEMACGRPAFEGPSQASLIGAIMRSEPRPIGELAPMNPPALDHLLRQCLAKDPDDRIQTAHDVKLRLQWIAEGGSQAGVPAPVAAARRSQSRLGWIVATAAGVLVLSLAGWIATHRPEPPRVMRFDIEAPPGAQTMTWARVSPDGRMVAFLSADSSGGTSIWVRSLDALESRKLAGTDGAGRMFWSPDSRHLGFISTGKLRKVAVSGGPVTAIADVQNGYDGSWSDRWVLFDGGNGDSIRGVPANGGSVRPFSSFGAAKRSITTHAWPSFLPDGKRFLFMLTDDAASVNGKIALAEVGSFKTRQVGTTGGRVEFAAPGWLVFPQENTLMAQPFDARAGKTNGDPMPIAERLQMGSYSGDFSVSRNGTLAYVSQSSSTMGRLLWVDRSGRTLSEVAPAGLYRDLALSPDGRRVAISIGDPQRNTEDLWVRDLVRGTSSRLTFEPGYEANPVWSPDGERIAYTSNRDGQFLCYIRSANGMGSEQLVARTGTEAVTPNDWSHDGSRLILRRFGSTNWDILATDPAGSKDAEVLLATPFNEQFGRLSPDGRWLIYQSNESGRNEIYLRPADGGTGRWQISVRGGRTAIWRADGREIFYVDLEGQVTAVSFAAPGSVEIGDPVALFRMPLIESTYVGQRFVASSDGQRFLVNTPAITGERPRVTVVTNFTAELGRK
jgi:Tol biopolymer transport system component